jgi:catalase
MKNDYLTTNQGMPIPDDQNSQTIGKRGPILLQDIVFAEKIAHFGRERIPERVVHAKGAGAHGYFKPYKCMAPFTKAKFLQDPLKETPVFTRFSLATVSKDGADTARDIRGFSVKFYTEDGNYDLVGNHIPVFPIRDAIQFPDLIHALKPDPVSNIRGGRLGNSRLWDYMSLRPEATNFLTYLFSDIGTIKSYRFMQGSSVNTYKWINACGKTIYVKYHWKPLAGVDYIDSKTATYLAGTDPDVASRDLFTTLASGATVEFEMRVQIINTDDEYEQQFDPLDPTKFWPENIFPSIPVGIMVLNKNPENFFSEIEQSAFSPAAIVPGIDFSNDKILQGRLFTYGDTQRYRLGTNYLELPINIARVPVFNNQQDGAMQIMLDKGTANYYPNTLGGGLSMQAPEMGEMDHEFVEGDVVREKVMYDDYTQAGDRYRTMSATQKDHLVSNILESLREAFEPIQKRMLVHFLRADNELGCRIAEGLNI